MRQGPLRHRWFAGFVGAYGLGAVADEVARLALPLLILDLTHSITAAAALRVVQSVPYILFGAPAGALIDRADKRRLLIVCDAASALLTTTIPLSAIFGFLLGRIPVPRRFSPRDGRGALGSDDRLQRRAGAGRGR